MWTKSFGNWLKSGSEPRPLWRRDPGLNLFAGICKKPLIQSGKFTQTILELRPSVDSLADQCLCMVGNITFEFCAGERQGSWTDQVVQS